MEFMSWAENMMAVRKMQMCAQTATSFVLNKQIYPLKSDLIYQSVALNRQVNKNQAEAPHDNVPPYTVFHVPQTLMSSLKPFCYPDAGTAVLL